MRNVGLDVLRFVAVVMVIFCHLHTAPPMPPSALAFLTSGGGLGVTLFFVLSGFLVSGLIFGEFDRRGGVDVGRFLVRRGFKLYPPYWALLALNTAVALASLTAANAGEFWTSLGIRLLFLQNYFPRLFDHTWTLAVEEHFYLLLAGLTALFLRPRAPRPFAFVPAFFLLTALVCGAARVWAAAGGGELGPADWAKTQYHIDGLFFGVWLSYLRFYHDLEGRLRAVPTWLLLAAGCVAAAWLPHVVLQIGPVGRAPAAWIRYLGAGLVVLAAFRLVESRIAAVRGMAFLGQTSYSTYLWHGWVNVLVVNVLERLAGRCDPWLYIVAYPVGAFVVGVAMHRLLEAPSMWLRDRWLPRGEGPPAAARSEGAGRS